MPESHHVIQLHGPWTWSSAETTLKTSAGIQREQRFRFPEELDFVIEQSVGDRVQLCRRFGRPSGLTPRHRVLLAADLVHSSCEFTLNGERLDVANTPSGVDISALLQERNQLQVSCTFIPAADESTPLRDVRILIVEPS